jgi:formyltetrahydrofolate-dependent phosphoribosylglycinamide formyltransferase
MMAGDPCRLAVLISGAGSTMVNLQDRIAAGEVEARIAVVVSSRGDAPGVERARALGLEARVLGRGPFKRDGAFDAAAYSAALAELLAAYSPELLVLAGFMTRLGAPVLDRWPALNVHPALLPRFGGDGFYGHHVHAAVLAAGARTTGATVHFVDADYDRGPIVAQEEIPVLAGDTPDSLAARVQEVERRIYPRAVAAFARGELAGICPVRSRSRGGA